ncbi:MAG TPA: hypothetical protein VGL57_07715 [Solirubrobacteraceae bacterium]|jgi:hypothetical protein
MKITIELPGPVGLTFEGDVDEFERFSGFVSELPELIGEIGPASVGELGDGGAGDGGGDDENGSSPLDPATLQARFSRVGASTDIERVTVIAQAAVENGREGADFALADKIYIALALAKPARWKVTFGNARTRGYLQNVGRGVYKPTVPGENYARGLGGPPKRRPAQRTVAATASAPALESGDGA